jgi:hypothetical protein
VGKKISWSEFKQNKNHAIWFDLIWFDLIWFDKAIDVEYLVLFYVYTPCVDFHRRNPLLFSKVKDVPKCDLAIQYALYSISFKDCKYISTICSLEYICGEVVSVFIVIWEDIIQNSW